MAPLEAVDFCLGLSHEVWFEHLFSFLTPNQLIPLRSVSKSFADLVWNFVIRFKTEYRIKVGTTNDKFIKTVDYFLSKLDKLSSLVWEDYDHILSSSCLTDIGLAHLAKLNHLERVDLGSMAAGSGRFMEEWIRVESPLLESVKYLSLYNVNERYFNLFHKFVNLETLIIEMDIPCGLEGADIRLPKSLTHLKMNCALCEGDMKKIVGMSPNLTHLEVDPHLLNDTGISRALLQLSKLKVFRLTKDEHEESLANGMVHEGKFYQVFQERSFEHLKELELTWFYTNNNEITQLQKSLSTLAPSLQVLQLNLTMNDEVNVNSSQNNTALAMVLSTLSNLTSLFITLPVYFGDRESKPVEKCPRLTNLKRLTIYGWDGLTVVLPLIHYLVTPTLESLKIGTFEEDVDFDFLTECTNLTTLRLNTKKVLNTETLQAMKENSSGDLRLKKLSGTSIHGNLIGYLPFKTITKLDLHNVQQEDLIFLKNFTLLENLKLDLSAGVNDFTQVVFPRSLRALNFNNCTSLTGLEPGFVTAISSLTKLDDVLFRYVPLVDEFVEQWTALSGDNEFRSIVFWRCDKLTSGALNHLKKFTSCDVLILHFCKQIRYSNDVSNILYEYPFIGVIFEERSMPFSFRSNEQDLLTEKHSKTSIEEFEKIIHELLETKQHHLAYRHLVALLTLHQLDELESDRQWFIYFNTLKCFVPGERFDGIEKVICELENMTNQCFANDGEKLKSFLNVLDKVLRCDEDGISMKSFTTGSLVLLKHGKLFECLQAFNLVVHSELDDLNDVRPLTKILTSKILEMTDIFEMENIAEVFLFIDNLPQFMDDDDYQEHEEVLDRLKKMINPYTEETDSTDSEDEEWSTYEEKEESTKEEEVHELMTPESLRENVPLPFIDAPILQQVTIPLGSLTTCCSPEFEAFNYRWKVTIVANGEMIEVSLTLASAIPIGEDTETSIKNSSAVHVHFMLMNYDLNPMSYFNKVEKFRFAGECCTNASRLEYHRPFSKKDNTFNIIVGMKLDHVDKIECPLFRVS